MEYRRLGSSDLHVSEIGLGSWLTFGGGVERERAVACIDRAFALGINFFDTANVYGRGAAEEFLGEVLSTRARDSYVLATKLYFPMSDTDRGLSRTQILKQVDASLLRLQTDYLGFSEWSAAQIEAAHALPGVERFVSSQPQYSLLWRLPERAVIPLSKEEGISQIVWSPLGQGVLTGKYKVGVPPPADSRASSDQMGWAMGRFLTDELFAAVDRRRPIASGAGLTLSQLALAWVLREPNLAAAIVGVSRPEQLDENAGASGVRLDEATLAAIDGALAGVVVNPE
jgi:aryl-alcohol dehydrogenase-like predicted oxidoreductase